VACAKLLKHLTSLRFFVPNCKTAVWPMQGDLVAESGVNHFVDKTLASKQVTT
jgi:hypothetical protein